MLSGDACSQVVCGSGGVRSQSEYDIRWYLISVVYEFGLCMISGGL